MRIIFLVLANLFCFSTFVQGATVRTNQSSVLDLQSSLLKFHQYDLILDLTIKPIQAFSIIAMSKPIEFQLKCSESVVGESSLLFDDTMERKSIKLSITAKDVRTKCPNGKFTLALNPNGVELEADLATVAFALQDLGEDADGFIQRYDADHASNVADMIYFHSQMSESIKSRESFHCLIKGYEQDVMKEEVVTDLVKEYKKIFLIEYVATDIDCSNPVSLVKEIDSCTTRPRTSFCGNYRLYLESIGWLKEARSKAAFFKAQIPANLTKLGNDLQAIIDQIDADLKASVAQTGAA